MLPPFINSEMDITSWFNQVLGRPAVAAANLAISDGLDVKSAFRSTKKSAQPYLVSAQHIVSMPIPDELLMAGGSDDPSSSCNKEPCTVEELKTGNAMPASLFEGLFETRTDSRGRHIAVPVLYPAKGRARPKLAKILIQVRQFSYKVDSLLNLSIQSYGPK